MAPKQLEKCTKYVKLKVEKGKVVLFFRLNNNLKSYGQFVTGEKIFGSNPDNFGPNKQKMSLRAQILV